MVLYAGIDLHSNNNVVVVQDRDDNVVGRQRLPNDLSTVCDWLEPYREKLAGVVVESTYNWYWLVDGLMEQGYTLHLANTVAIHQGAQSRPRLCQRGKPDGLLVRRSTHGANAAKEAGQQARPAWRTRWLFSSTTA